jgi:hypothetical protein
MKTLSTTLITICFTLSLLTSTVTLAQDTMNHDDGQSTPTSRQPIPLTGKISDTRQTFIADSDGKSWTIVNPDDVKGHENQHVTVMASVDADKNEINVVSVRVIKK